MPHQLLIEELLSAADIQFVDVRSEAEFAHAHIPGSINIPLLRNEERIKVGTLYKQEGRDAAVKAGFECAGPRFPELYDAFLAISKEKQPIFYCWRGGLRSQISATILEWGGKSQTIVKGGYKAYRNLVLKGFDRKQKMAILSGMTGVGKTEILALLAAAGEQVIDLEALAHHKGSVLGSLGQPAQYSNEMFENTLFEAWRKLDPSKPVFVENESRRIGNNVLPASFWNQMEQATLMDVQTPKNIRLTRILKEYGHFDKGELAACTDKIKKRLGGLSLKLALEALENNDIAQWAEILMDYYDRTYAHSRAKRGFKGNELLWDWDNSKASLQQLHALVYGKNSRSV